MLLPTMTLPFSKLPSTARVPPATFKMLVPQEQLDELKALVQLSKTAPPTYESQQSDRRFGITSDWLDSMKQKWVKDFDWRACEASANVCPQFIATVDHTAVHFVALFSEKEDAVPIVLLHGWPGSFLEFLPLLHLFQQEYTPETLPYHLIVPSLPGYTFSTGPPLDRNYTSSDVARLVDRLMKDLGFEQGYVAQGGDIGSRIARALGADARSCKAVHLNFCPVKRPEGISDESLTATEKTRLVRENAFRTTGTAYAFEHGTRTSTIGHVLATNPVSLLAWIGEKMLDWVDEPLEPQTILEFVTLYWLTETIPRAIYFYREELTPQRNPMPYIEKPLGFSSFPKELTPVPRSWIETTGNLVHYKDHDKGGHFAALERPQDLKADLSEFVDQVWPGIMGRN